MATKNKKKADLLPYNPLLTDAPQEIRPILPEEEAEQKAELIEQVESLATLNKEVLEVKRRQVELIVDNKKMDAAQKLIDGINVVAEKALNAETITKIVSKEDLTPMDLKFLAEAMDKMANTLKNLMTPSMQDELGQRKRIKINAAFRTPSGEQAAISMEIPNNG